MAPSACSVCLLHHNADARARYEIGRTPLWILRHHPDPAPLEGWLLLDARRHLGGPIKFNAEEAVAWGSAVQQASQLVQQISGCDRVYAIAFGEGARHLHLHLIPRFDNQLNTEAWRVADLYRAVVAGQRPAAEPQRVAALVQQGRSVWRHLRSSP
jgi:diadenosine tetraphosphate (Ap4A) HIT family hydrolase